MIPILTISKAEAMNPSRRNTMEDVHVTYSPGQWGCNDDEMTYIGVYDGHGGRDTVDFLEGTLHKSIAEELNIDDDANADNDDNDDNADNADNDDNDDNADNDDNTTSIHAKIERAFLMTDVESKMAGVETSGSTVVVCLVKKYANGRKIAIHSANAGDARAVLSCQPTTSISLQSPAPEPVPSPTESSTSTTATSTTTATKETKESTPSSPRPTSTSTGNIYANISSPKSKRLRQQYALIPKAHRLTYDHKSDNRGEIKRIEDAGGFLLRNRVLGIMAVARSLGDHGMKEYVIGRPFVNTTIIDLDDTAFSNYIGGNGHGHRNDLPSSECFNSEFIIVACDGIWDVMDDQEAVNMVRKYVKQGSIRDGDVKKYKDTAARMLCKQALERGSTDNVTVLVVWF